MIDGATIRPLVSGDYPAFFAYLNAQLAINGKQGFDLFQPVSRTVVEYPSEKEASFVAGLSKNIGQSGWRRAWIICSDAGALMGHLDLRAHSDSSISHRALLGMGVARECRRQGVANRLLDFAGRWVVENDCLDWIDLEVLAGNKAAVNLYRQAGFDVVGTIPDMYRIDGDKEAVIRMTKKFATETGVIDPA